MKRKKRTKVKHPKAKHGKNTRHVTYGGRIFEPEFIVSHFDLPNLGRKAK
jgi:hypothetical protein